MEYLLRHIPQEDLEDEDMTDVFESATVRIQKAEYDTSTIGITKKGEPVAKQPPEITMELEEVISGVSFEELDKFLTALSQQLSVHFELLFESAFGSDLWRAVVKIKPPWTMLDLCALIFEHKYAIFTDIFRYGAMEQMTGLYKYLRRSWEQILIGQGTETKAAACSAINRLKLLTDKIVQNGEEKHKFMTYIDSWSAHYIN